MPSHCQPQLVNDTFDDPGLIIRFPNHPETVLIDAGSLHRLSLKDLFSIGHLYVTHAHMDHFIGFDQLLRVLLGRKHHLNVYGPEGIIDHVRGKLGGYRWNLVGDTQEMLTIRVTEVLTDHWLVQELRAADGFMPAAAPVRRPALPRLTRTPLFCARYVLLDHDTPCLGIAIEETDHVKIDAAAISDCGLKPGQWIERVKTALRNHARDDTLIDVEDDRSGETRQWSLEKLARQIARIHPGRKLVYVTDAGDTPDNRQKIRALARDAHHLYIEAAFREHDHELAARKYHLTAARAGELAAACHVRGFTLFHHSPRYRHDPDGFQREADAAYQRYRQGRPMRPDPHDASESAATHTHPAAGDSDSPQARSSPKPI